MVKIEKKELHRLLKAYHRLRALEYGGVDNWSWYGESMSDYLNDCGEESFSDIADKEIENCYEEVE